jgi:hypothetical protein
MDTLIILAIATLAIAILGNLAFSFGVDSRDGLGRVERAGLS